MLIVVCWGEERPIVRMMERKAKKVMLVMSLTISSADRANTLAPHASLRASSIFHVPWPLAPFCDPHNRS